MTRQEATFTIDEASDAHAARRILERLFDSVREETSSASSADDTDVLDEFAALREAVEPPAPGSLTVTYERESGAFEN
jgi:hypothetical protein